MRGILIFVLCIAAVGAAMGGVAAGVKNKRVNIFKTQAGAWLFTIVMVIAAIGIGYAKSPANSPAPEPGYGDSYHWEGGQFLWDNANVLSDRTLRELDQRNERLWRNHSVVIGVVTCNYGGDDLYDYALQCAEDMGLSGYDFTVVLDISGENYWLVQGDKLTRDFPDGDCSDYAYNYMEASFAKGDYDKAVLSLTEALENWYEDYYG